MINEQVMRDLIAREEAVKFRSEKLSDQSPWYQCRNGS
jgi:hypothetical protein